MFIWITDYEMGVKSRRMYRHLFLPYKNMFGGCSVLFLPIDIIATPTCIANQSVSVSDAIVFVFFL